MHRSKASFLILMGFALFLLAWPKRANPCGICLGDDFAAVYSYEALEKVKAKPHQLEFVVLKIEGAVLPATVLAITQWFTKKSGVDFTTFKISASQKAIGFVLAKVEPKEKLVEALKKKFPSLNFKILPATWSESKPLT